MTDYNTCDKQLFKEPDYKAIADRLVERGIGDRRNGGYTIDESYVLVSGEITGVDSAYDFCHDWRAAGACMEKAPLLLLRCLGETPERLKDPLAIILAYLEATDGHQD